MKFEAFSRTKSVCPHCLRVLEAERAVGEDGCVYLLKRCPEHGEFSCLIWEGPLEEYLAWNTAPGGGNTPPATVPARDGCPNDCGLCSAHESAGCCVLLELTKRCNLNCPVCFASAGGGEAGPDARRDFRAVRHARRARRALQHPALRRGAHAARRPPGDCRTGPGEGLHLLPAQHERPAPRGGGGLRRAAARGRRLLRLFAVRRPARRDAPRPSRPRARENKAPRDTKLRPRGPAGRACPDARAGRERGRDRRDTPLRA